MDTEGTAYAAETGPDPASEPAVARPRKRGSWLRGISAGIGSLLVVVIIAGFVIRVPYTTIAPGEALSLPPRVTINGTTSYPNGRGDIRLLFVRLAYRVTVWQYVRARLDSDIDLAKDGSINPGGLTPSQQNQQGLQQMADAKTAATKVALAAAGYTVKNAPGFVVSDLVPGMPAIETLLWGDVILTVNGKKLEQSSDLNAVIDKDKVGDDLALGIVRAGKPLKVTVKVGVFTEPDSLKGHKGIGVELSPRFSFPVKVNVDTTDIGGPSAGLAMTLAIFDDLTPGNLTGGAKVAVTGTIDADGNVGEIGGIEQKAVAARAAGVSLFLVPQCSPNDSAAGLAGCKADLARAAKRAGSKIKVIPVSTFTQALAELRANGGDAVKVSEPTSSTTIAA